MSEQQSGSFGSRKKVWIGAGIAVAAAIVVVSTGVFPPSGSDTVGTIVPAERYRAPQNTAADVKLGDPSTASSTPVNTSDIGLQGGVQSATQSGIQSGVQQSGAR